ncbi:DUF2723 domain-containing protein [bacterium]|nr:DUF2723 domain-containing protein [candidate division CSSED10-310 bacterium]
MTFLTHRRHGIVSLGIFVYFFSLFLWTGPQDIIPDANCGELVTAASLLGIAHPTGYPTWVILAHSFIRDLPLGSQAFRTSVISAVIGALILVVTYQLLFLFFAKHWILLPIIAAISVDPLFWKQCISAEVYGFHLLLGVTLCWSVSIGLIQSRVPFIYITFFLAGLALTNHLTTVFLLPLLLIAGKRVFQLSIRPVDQILRSILFFILGLTPYLYLPIRSVNKPLFCWHQPASLESLIQHITGSQFHSHIFDSSRNLWFSRIMSIPSALHHPVQVICFCLGIISLLYTLVTIKNRSILPAVILIISGISIFPLLYTIHDIDSYFLPLVWLLYASNIFLFRHIHIAAKDSPWMGVAVGFIFTGSAFYFSGDKLTSDVDQSLGNFGRMMMSSVPGSGPLFFQNDNEMNSLSYLQGVERYRDDLLCIDKNKNIKPMFFRADQRKYPIVSIVTRLPDEYRLFSPHGLVFIDRSRRINPDCSLKISSRLLNRNLLQVSEWNPYFTEMKLQILITSAENEFEWGSWQEGIILLNQAAELNTAVDSRRYIASIMAARGLLKEAIRQNWKTLEAFPDDPATLNNTAFYDYIIGYELDEAESLARRAVRLDPQNSSYLLTLYRILLIRGKIDSAQQLESAEDSLITPDLIRQRIALQQIEPDLVKGIDCIDSPEDVNRILDATHSADLLHYRRFLLQRKIQLMPFESSDLQEFYNISIDLGYSNAALSIIMDIKPENRTQNWTALIRRLQQNCYNFSQVRN